MASKRQGLRLNLPGAPNTPHTLPGVPGCFYPDAPTPVGAAGELPLEVAKEFDSAKGTPLELVDIPAAEVAAAEQLAVDSLEASRKGQIIAKRAGFKGAEASRADDERNATKGAS